MPGKSIARAVAASALLAAVMACSPRSPDAVKDTVEETADAAKTVHPPTATPLPESVGPSLTAEERALSYRARGNEPGWQLTIADHSLRLVADYGETTIEARVSGEQRANRSRTVLAVADAERVQVDIRPVGCNDSMSGDRYADTVTVTVGARRFTGCGGAHWLRGNSWRLVTMNGEQIIGGEPLTVEFGDDSRVTGYAGCNRFTGSYSLEGSRLAFTAAMAATKRGCTPQELMRQEVSFLTVLPSMTEATTNEKGELVLGNSAGAQLVFQPVFGS